MARMRKPAAPVKPLALIASARLGGLRSLLKRAFCLDAFSSREPYPLRLKTLSLRRNTHRQLLDTAHKAGVNSLRLADHLDAVKTFQHFLPHDLELQLGEPHADAAVDAEAERQVGARTGAIDDEFFGLVDALFVAVARDIPHHHAFALLDR